MSCPAAGRTLGRSRHEGETGRKRICVCVWVCVCERECVKQRQRPAGFDDGIGPCHDARLVGEYGRETGNGNRKEMRRWRVLENPRNQGRTGFGICREEKEVDAPRRLSRSAVARCRTRAGAGNKQRPSRCWRSVCSLYDRDCLCATPPHPTSSLLRRSGCGRAAAPSRCRLWSWSWLRSRPLATSGSPSTIQTHAAWPRSMLSRIAKPTLCPGLGEKKGGAREKANFRQRVVTGLESTYAWLEPVKKEGGGQGGEGSREKKNPKTIVCLFCGVCRHPSGFVKRAQLCCEVPANHRQRSIGSGEERSLFHFRLAPWFSLRAVCGPSAVSFQSREGAGGGEQEHGDLQRNPLRRH